MPRVSFAPAALQDLKRLRELLRPKNAAAAKRAGEAIASAVRVLQQQPHIDRPIDDMDPEYRELVIDYGDSGYIARYRFAAGNVVVLAIRHQKEAGA